MSYKRASKEFVKKSMKFTAYLFRGTRIGFIIYLRLLKVLNHSFKNSNIEFLIKMNPNNFEYLLNLKSKSQSQQNQDLFVISELNLVKLPFKGFFVEIGAANGINLSNTYLLETEFNWSGILVEPAIIWHQELVKNRPNSILDFNCAHNSSGISLNFYQTDIPELSTLKEFSDKDNNVKLRDKRIEYKVKTITLNDLFIKHEAPRHINYLSLDTEGSEFDILNSVNFEIFTFDIITVEHNFTPQRVEIHKLLTSRGFVRKFEDISGFDDWYVNESIISKP